MFPHNRHYWSDIISKLDQMKTKINQEYFKCYEWTKPFDDKKENALSTLQPKKKEEKG